MSETESKLDTVNRLKGLTARTRQARTESPPAAQTNNQPEPPDDEAAKPAVHVGANDVRGFIEASQYNAQETRREVKQQMNAFSGAMVFKPLDTSDAGSDEGGGSHHHPQTAHSTLSQESGTDSEKLQDHALPADKNAAVDQEPIASDANTDILDNETQSVEPNTAHRALPGNDATLTPDDLPDKDISTHDVALEDHAAPAQSAEADNESSITPVVGDENNHKQPSEPLIESLDQESVIEPSVTDDPRAGTDHTESDTDNYQPIFDPLTNKISDETNRLTDKLLQELSEPPQDDYEQSQNAVATESAASVNNDDYEQSHTEPLEPEQYTAVDPDMDDDVIEPPEAVESESDIGEQSESNTGSVGDDITPIDEEPNQHNEPLAQQDEYDDIDDSYIMMPPEDVAEIMDSTRSIQSDIVPQPFEDDDTYLDQDEYLDDEPSAQTATPTPPADNVDEQPHVRMQSAQARALASVFNNIGKLVHGLPQADEDKVQAAARFIREAEQIKAGLNQVFLAEAPEEIPSWLRAQISTIAIDLAVSSRTEVAELIEISKMLAQSTLVEPVNEAPLRYADIAIKAAMVRALSEIYLQLEDACDLIATKGSKEVSDYLYDNRSELLVKIQGFYMRSLKSARQMLGIADMSEPGQLQVLSTVLMHVHQLHKKHLAKDILSLTLNAGGGMSPARLFASSKHTVRRILGGEGQDKIASQVATILALSEESVNNDIAQIIESTQHGKK